MAIPQQKFREIVFELLFSRDIGQTEDKDTEELLMMELQVTKKAVREAQQKTQKILEKLSEIDRLISEASHAYAFERIHSVERNILRLGVFELLYDESIPPKVAIAEAVRLTRKFATPESAKFVNAVLDNLYKTSQGDAVDSSQMKEAVDQLIESEQKAKKANEQSN